jgi:hypothetical protein
MQRVPLVQPVIKEEDVKGNYAKHGGLWWISHRRLTVDIFVLIAVVVSA